MTNLTGTEKQIEWAESIKATWISQLDNVLSTAQARVADDSMPDVWGEIVSDLHSQYVSKVNSIKTANGVLHNRRINFGDSLFNHAKTNHENYRTTR